MYRIVMVALVTLALAVGPAVAQERAPSERQLELARKYVQQVQGAGLRDLMAETVRSQMAASGKSDLTSEERKAVEAIIIDAGADFMNRVLDRMTPLYAAAFTEEELETVVAFNETPIGRSILQKSLRLVMAEQEVMQELIPDFFEKLIVRLCALEKCTPEQLEEFRAEAGVWAPEVGLATKND